MSSLKEKLKNFVIDYSKVSTIGGLVHVFREDYTVLKRLFWVFIIVAMVTIGVYWSGSIYVSWKDNQVLVTIDSVGK